MSDAVTNPRVEVPVEAILREELAHGDAVLGTVAPILGHLVATSDNSLFSDAIVAQVRGMTAHVASQLLIAQGTAAAAEDVRGYADTHLDQLMGALLADPGFIAHCHALAVERQFADRIQARSAIDPVLTPLLQSLIASDDPGIASGAMATLAAQARFMQHQRRMELPLTELPGDLFHAVLLLWRTETGEAGEDITARAEIQLRSAFDESGSRLGLLARLIAAMGNGALAALSLSHAGAALFLTALAHSGTQTRDTAVLSTSERQMGRLALALRAAGLKPKDVEEQFLLIHPDIALPDGFDLLRSDRAADLLCASALASAS